MTKENIIRALLEIKRDGIPEIDMAEQQYSAEKVVIFAFLMKAVDKAKFIKTLLLNPKLIEVEINGE